MAKGKNSLTVDALTHHEAKRRNIPTEEHRPVLSARDARPVPAIFARRDRDLDPQLVWRGKDEQFGEDLHVPSLPLYIQEKMHPKALIDDLLRETKERRDENADIQEQPDLFDSFNGLPGAKAKAEFYQHDQNWSNRMILGDSLYVMTSLAEREGLRGKVQCIFFDPPYGIRFNSNFQWSTTSRDVKDGDKAHITREPEQVKAFRDTWRDGIHSYLTYLRDRLTVAKELLTESGSIFVQIGDENVHRVRTVMDEVFGEENYISILSLQKTAARSSQFVQNVSDYVIWYAKNNEKTKFRRIFVERVIDDKLIDQYPIVYRDDGLLNEVSILSKKVTHEQLARSVILTSSHAYSKGKETVFFQGRNFGPGSRYWSTNPERIYRIGKAGRLIPGKRSISYLRRLSDYPYMELTNTWVDVATGGGADRLYVVQTVPKVIQRCILMTTDPGDLVLDPTCGSGTTAYVAEQWGRRWITIDTSRVAITLARARLMGARYPWYLLADSIEGQRKEAELTQCSPPDTPTYDDIRQGFVYARAPHITLKSIANNAKIDAIWDRWQETLEPLREKLNKATSQIREEWEIPREADDSWPAETKAAHEAWWKARIKRQSEIDASIAARADVEFLYDRPYEDKGRIRVAGPFTMETLSPHRMVPSGEDAEEEAQSYNPVADDVADFVQKTLNILEVAGIQQADKAGKIIFTSISPWEGRAICAQARFTQGEVTPDSEEEFAEHIAAITIGPQFGTMARPDLVAAAHETSEAGFDVLIACAFSYDASSTELSSLGSVPILKARMNADLYMGDALKNTDTGNLFVIFGEPDIVLEDADNDLIRVRIRGINVYRPQTGQVTTSSPEEIACWFIDTNYDEESFFVRHAYFLGASSDPFKALKTSLRAEIDADAWESLRSSVSRPFVRPQTGRIAVKAVNHLGDEVMQVIKA